MHIGYTRNTPLLFVVWARMLTKLLGVNTRRFAHQIQIGNDEYQCKYYVLFIIIINIFIINCIYSLAHFHKTGFFLELKANMDDSYDFHYPHVHKNKREMYRRCCEFEFDSWRDAVRRREMNQETRRHNNEGGTPQPRPPSPRERGKKARQRQPETDRDRCGQSPHRPRSLTET
jgi:hypothetical protein